MANLPQESPEWQRLASHLTVGETYFFRDRACFEALERQVLPALITARRAQGIFRLRLWSAGCATGEEAYSLAILLERLLPDRAEWALTILATDINPEALDAAQRGRYREWALRDTPAWIRDRYFDPRGAETFELHPEIRRMVAFAPLNLAEHTYPSMVTNTGAMDLILCRNVLMYFTREAQLAAVARLQMALVPRGWLVVNPAEGSAELLRPLVPVNFPAAIFYRKESASPSPPASSWEPETGFPAPQAPFPVAPPLGELAAPEAAVPAPPTAPAEVPPDPAILLERARTLADQGDLEQARHLCLAALAQDRLNPEMHFLLAAICQERGEVSAALEALRRAIYLAPEFAPAHFLQGSLLLRQAKLKQGRRSMETVVHLLSSVPHDEPVPGSDGLTAGRLAEMARAYLEVR
ncbi:MAG: chemotaxis protein CheR [candidate division NC10 bacterium]|nr:chemotaxis protein CheR [candidate division NC10 bacterium]